MAQLNIEELQNWKTEIEGELANLKSLSIENEVDALQCKYEILCKVDMRLMGKGEEQKLFQEKYLNPIKEQLEGKRKELEEAQKEDYKTEHLLNKILYEIGKTLAKD